MKKNYIIIACLLPLLSFAQPTIQQSDLPYVGIVWLAGVNHSFTGPILGGGAGQSWDYSGLVNAGTDTTAFVSATGSPYVGQFPSANCAVVDQSDGTWQYFENTSTGFYLDGGSKSNSPLIKLNPGKLYVPVPFTYLDTKQSSSRFVYDTTASGVPYREILYFADSFVGDGYGTLTLPSGVYSNVLRVTDTTVETDSLLYDPGHTGTYSLISKSSKQSVNYHWFRHGVAGSTDLLEIDADSAGTTASKSSYYLSNYILSVNSLTAGVNSMHAYPNPAATTIHFDLQGMKKENVSLKVYNAFGKEVTALDVNGISNYDLPVDKLASGIYYYSLVSDNNRESGKFSVLH